MLISLFRQKEVMAHPPYGSAQKERIRFALCCVAVIGVTNLCSHRRVPSNSVLTARIKEIVQQYRFAFFFRQTVQGFGKLLRGNFLAADNERLFCFIICKILVANVELIFFLWR